MTRRIGMLAVAATLVAATAACFSDDPGEPVGSDLATGLEADIDRARIAGAGDTQVAVLEQAHHTGEMTFETYSEAIDRALRCAREEGAAVAHGTTIEHLGVQLRNYSISTETTDEREPLPGITVHRCVAEHSFWVERWYQLQPVSLEAAEAHYERYRSAIVECLSSQDIAVEPDLTYEELSAQFRDPQDESFHIFGRCLDESGYSRS